MRVRLLVPLALAVLPAALAAQDARPRALVGAEYYGVSFGAGIGTKSVSEFAVPLGVILPIGKRLSFDVGTYFVNAQREDETGGTASLSGLTDVVLRGGFQVIPDVVALTVSMNLPTGQASLDGDQLQVANATATDLIPFPVTSFGSGFNVTSGLAVAVPVGGWALGAGGSYRYNGEYQPLDTGLTGGSATNLTPGAEFRLRLGLDRIVGQGRVSFGATYSTFSRDEFGADQINGGRRFITQASWSFPVGNNTVSLFAWDIARTADATDSTATSAALPEANENTLAVGAITSLQMGRNTLRPSLEFRRSWRGQPDLTGNGSLFSAGARYFVQASDRFMLVPGLRFDTGRITGVSVTGFSFSLSVRANL